MLSVVVAREPPLVRGLTGRSDRHVLGLSDFPNLDDVQIGQIEVDQIFEMLQFRMVQQGANSFPRHLCHLNTKTLMRTVPKS